MSKLLKVVTGLMAILFLAATVVQYDDPDPARWMAIYGSATLACILALMGVRQRIIPCLVGIAAIVWAATLWNDVWGKVGFRDLIRDIKMDTPEIECGRELGGLVLVALWMIVLCLAIGKKPKGS